MPHTLICAECGVSITDGSYAVAAVLMADHCREAGHPWRIGQSHVILAIKESGEFVVGPEELFKKADEHDLH